VQQVVSGPEQYVSVTGTIVLDAQEAQAFTISSSGQLQSGRSYFSTSGLVPFEPFTPRPHPAAISTTFSNRNNTLVWTSPSFANGQAQFCLMGSMLEAAYDGYLPAGCTAVTVYLAPTSATTNTVSILQQTTTSFSSMMAVGSGTAVSSTPTPTPPYAPGRVYGQLAIADPVGCLTSPSNAAALSGISETTATLEQCVDYCSIYSYFGVQNGQCSKPQTMDISLTWIRKSMRLW
jgi:hypothetical protein